VTTIERAGLPRTRRAVVERARELRPDLAHACDPTDAAHRPVTPHTVHRMRRDHGVCGVACDLPRDGAAARGQPWAMTTR